MRNPAEKLPRWLSLLRSNVGERALRLLLVVGFGLTFLIDQTYPIGLMAFIALGFLSFLSVFIVFTRRYSIIDKIYNLEGWQFSLNNNDLDVELELEDLIRRLSSYSEAAKMQRPTRMIFSSSEKFKYIDYSSAIKSNHIDTISSSIKIIQESPDNNGPQIGIVWPDLMIAESRKAPPPSMLKDDNLKIISRYYDLAKSSGQFVYSVASPLGTRAGSAKIVDVVKNLH